MTLETTQQPSKRRRLYQPISPKGAIACKQWLDETLQGKSPDPQLLAVGLEGTSIQSATLHIDNSDNSPYFAVVVEGRSPRILDVPSLLYARLLMAGGGYLWMNDKNVNRHYLKLDIARPWLKRDKRLSMTMLRLIGDAGPNHQVNQVNMRQHGPSPLLSHYDHRRRNLMDPAFMLPSYDKIKVQRIKTDRGDAERAAVDQYQKRKGRAKKGFVLTGAELKAMLREAARLVDRLPLGTSRVVQ